MRQFLCRLYCYRVCNLVLPILQNSSNFPPPAPATFPTVDALDVWRQMGCLIEQFILLGVVVLRSLFDCNLFRYGFVELRNFCMVCLCIFSSIYLYISVV